MTTALAAGSLLALGHHLFYAHLDHHEAPSGSYAFAGRTFPEQQFNLAVGTAFAFFVRTFLGIAISCAYVQLFWQSASHSKRAATLAELDWGSAGLDDVFGLFKVKYGWRYPMLVMLAVVYW